MMSKGKVRIMSLFVWARVKLVAFAAVARIRIAPTAFPTTGTHIKATVQASASLQRAVLQLRRRIGRPCIARVLVRPKRQPRTAAEQEQHAQAPKQRLGKGARDTAGPSRHGPHPIATREQTARYRTEVRRSLIHRDPSQLSKSALWPVSQT
jgi:hypothetical protein